jgi:hypothetical protein
VLLEQPIKVMQVVMVLSTLTTTQRAQAAVVVQVQ